MLSRASTGSIARKPSMRVSGDAAMPDAQEAADTAVEPDAQIAAGPDADPDVLIDGFKPPEVHNVHDVGQWCESDALCRALLVQLA